MLCPQCTKLAILNTKKSCVKCHGEVLNKLSSLCDKCSLEQSVCSICLKKLHYGSGQNKFTKNRGCRSCGG